jgi:hypothetical protein
MITFSSEVTYLFLCHLQLVYECEMNGTNINVAFNLCWKVHCVLLFAL